MRFYIFINDGDFGVSTVGEDFSSVGEAENYIKEHFSEKRYKFTIAKEVVSYKLEGELKLLEVS